MPEHLAMALDAEEPPSHGWGHGSATRRERASAHGYGPEAQTGRGLRTPTGQSHATRRYPDLWFVDEHGNNVFFQIGRTDSKGWPVGRELDAGGDLSNSGSVFWVPYR